MKVCHMTSVHTSRDVRIFCKMCTSLAKSGYDVSLVAPGASFQENGVQVIGVGLKGVSRLRRMFQTAYSVYRCARSLKADIYHFHDPELLLYGLLLKNRHNRVIFDSHEFYALQIKSKMYIPRFLRSIIARIYYAVESFVCKRIDAVVGVCDVDGKNYFEDRCKVVQYIRNYPLLSEFHEMMQMEPHFHGSSVCYIGKISKNRGITNLVLAAAAANVTLDLGGSCSPPGYLQELQSMPEWESVTFHGFVQREQLKTILSSVFAGMATLLNRGQYYKLDALPVKVYEYMAAGIPTILSDSPYNTRFIEQEQCGICVDPEDVSLLANTIVYLQTNMEEAVQMGLNGRAAILKRYNWEKEFDNLLCLYQTLSEGL